MDRAELRRLAEAATPGPWRKIKDSEDAWGHIEVAPHRHIYVEGRSLDEARGNVDYIAAASPDVVLGLLDEIERLREEAKQALVIVGNIWRELGQTQYERDQLRAEVERLKHIRAGECDVGLCRSFEGEREEIRAVAVRLRGVLEDVAHEAPTDPALWMKYTQDMARNVLADPEVEKL